MAKRVVVTGLGVVAPNGVGVSEFTRALRAGKSGIRHDPERVRLGFGCEVSGIPQLEAGLAETQFSVAQLKAMNEVMLYAGLASLECWADARLTISDPASGNADYSTGAIFGTGIGGVDTIAARLIPFTDAAQIRRLGGTVPEQVMCSAVSAFLGGILGLGGHVSTNSSACCTGTEAVILGAREVASGRAERMLVGGSEASSLYISAGFDAMRVLSRNFNSTPAAASRPLSASAAGFVPGAGAGAIMLESLESALGRGARIYAEILGGEINCGGQRNGGTTTASSATGVVRCITQALRDADVAPEEVDYVNGHLTATGADPIEIANLSTALQRSSSDFPLVNATKSMIGHALGASGALECVATVVQIAENFLHPSINCEDLHPRILPIAASVITQTISKQIGVALKTSFGFGDVNACLVLSNYSQDERIDERCRIGTKSANASLN